MTQAEALIRAERERQEAKWGEQNHDDLKWLAILTEEVGELAQAILEGNASGIKVERIQVAAVAVAWMECADRREQKKEGWR